MNKGALWNETARSLNSSKHDNLIVFFVSNSYFDMWERFQNNFKEAAILIIGRVLTDALSASKQKERERKNFPSSGRMLQQKELMDMKNLLSLSLLLTV